MTSLLRIAARAFVVALAAALTLPGSQLAAQKLSPGLILQIDSLYRAFAEENHLPGVVYGIIIDTSLAYSGATGYANLSDSTPVTVSTAFRAASMTKSFTALAILRLRDEGKLRLDDPVGLWLPELDSLRYLSDDAPVLTIRQLLTHTGGFPQDDPWADRQLESTEEELSGMIRKGLTMSNVPGITYEYSNLGYTLLGRIIQAVTGITCQSYIDSLVFRPLGMNRTVWEYNDLPEGVMAKGYRHSAGGWSEEELLHDGPFGAMGGLISTVGDFARYAIMHLSAWPPRDGAEGVALDEGTSGMATSEGAFIAPLKRSSLREMHSPASGVSFSSSTLWSGGPDCQVIVAYGYGLRWSLDCRERRKIYHNGGLPGFGSNWTIMPDYGIGVVAFSNRTYGSTYAVNQKVLELLMASLELKPRRPEITAILSERMNDLVRIMPDWETAGTGDVFSDNFFIDNPVEDLRAETARIYRAAGAITDVKELIPENSLRGSFAMECEGGTITVRFTLTPEPSPRIQSVSISLTPKKQ
ncbi:MAG: beta-lactamase family protein [Bacteroidales bacterium]|jgi:CubicO group peptidase (beta-lactamase class C family)|nr:beta-lactamase family protein [Bacteroidales bacterium]